MLLPAGPLRRDLPAPQALIGKRLLSFAVDSGECCTRQWRSSVMLVVACTCMLVCSLAPCQVADILPALAIAAAGNSTYQSMQLKLNYQSTAGQDTYGW